MIEEDVRLLFTYADRGMDRKYYRDLDKRVRGHNSVYCEQSGIMWACSKDGEPSHTVNNYTIVYN